MDQREETQEGALQRLKQIQLEPGSGSGLKDCNPGFKAISSAVEQLTQNFSQSYILVTTITMSSCGVHFSLMNMLK
ncbi:hypothetical protein OJAV_G00234580 [Oryzias javanicus]|uniref:Uncharacterized protein n=1 Tax=Oryzias javanicus TaxID=123683 RepID=A0A3S2MBP6_ORYJA|nr:hypothetical protein OJAV_G00234580 [Oryzias javanicus]